MAALVVVNPNRFRLPNAATKKAVRLADYNYNKFFKIKTTAVEKLDIMV